MRQTNILTEQEFNSLTEEQRVKELRKLTKRANVRLALQEESNAENVVYNQAFSYNQSVGKQKNRFYEGSKYQNNDDIEEAYMAVSNYLNNRNSTLTGIKDTVQNRVNQFVSNQNFEISKIRNISDYEKNLFASEASKIANKRLGELEKKGMTHFAYEQADYYNQEMERNRNRFYRGMKFSNEEDRNIHIETVMHFLNSKTSTVQGYTDVTVDKINIFKEKGINIPWGKESDFFDYLSSVQFKSLALKGDSNQIAEIYSTAINAVVERDKIEREFTKFQNGEITLDEVQERLKIAKWQEGGLLK